MDILEPLTERRDVMQEAPTGPSTVAPVGKKRTIKRASFMGERCINPNCNREFKIEKDYPDYKLTCPYCAKGVKSTRILETKANSK
jgi:hypothetical protein